MSHPYNHARSSAKKFGGEAADYLDIHRWFDQTKSSMADARHRLMLHNSTGIFVCEQVFGVTFTRASDSRAVPTRLIGEQHVIEDFGRIPTLEECFRSIEIEPWMMKGARNLSKELEIEPIKRSA